MATNTIAAELLQQINLTKLHPNPNYLSAADAISVDEFEQTEYGLEYTLDTSNIQWGSAPNDSHIFDIFSEFRAHRDSMKTRLEMLQFVAENTLRYKWDCHVLFTMHGVHIDTWLKQMSYWGTRADELAIYALSDMLNVHSFVVTKNRPWTTVDSSVNGTVMEILRLCPVKLVYLGDNNFGRLWPKLNPSKDVSTNQTNIVPIFPDSQPLVTIPAPPTLAELETAQALVTLQQHVGDEPITTPVPNMNLGNNELLLQEPNVLPVPETTYFSLEAPPWVEAEPLTDAMDKIVGHTDISNPEPNHWMKSRDCMDIVTGRISELVDTVNLSNLPVFDFIKIKPCIVELVRIKNIPTVKLPSLQTKEDLLSLGQYFTRSKLRPKKSRQNRKPRRARSNIDYEEKSPLRDSEKKSKNKRLKPKPPACGPSESRIRSQSVPTVQPSVRLPPAEKPDSEEPDREETLTNLDTPKRSGADPDTKIKTKAGKIETQTFTLKKRKRQRTYGCKLCVATLSSAHLLTVHHREEHEILYCDICTKAFNNPTSLVRHKYQHREHRYVCACGASFAFSSQLQTHAVVHRWHASHHCVYPNCKRSFKNQGDLKRHAAEHYKQPHECPDRDYKNSDIRNLESHHLKHTDINKYTCKNAVKASSIIHSTGDILKILINVLCQKEASLQSSKLSLFVETLRVLSLIVIFLA